MLGYQRKDYEGVIKALSEGSMQPEKMITSKIHIDRVVEDGYTPLIHVSFLPLPTEICRSANANSSVGEGEACKDSGGFVSLDIKHRELPKEPWFLASARLMPYATDQSRLETCLAVPIQFCLSRCLIFRA